jgi:hypothetical protein
MAFDVDTRWQLISILDGIRYRYYMAFDIDTRWHLIPILYGIDINTIVI